MTSRTIKRRLPRPFNLPWGKGMIIEEASFQAPDWEPTIQLLEFEGGYRELRFCYYHRGSFGRGPMILGEEHLESMCEALKEAPEIRKLLARIVK